MSANINEKRKYECAPKDKRRNKHTKERNEKNRIAAKRNIANGKNPLAHKRTCEHCQKVVSQLTYVRKHGDNCPVFKKQQRSIWIAVSKKVR